MTPKPTPFRRIVLILAFLAMSFGVGRSASAEAIRSFDVQLDVLESGNVYVTERIDYDFENTEHHGIIRLIPFQYNRNGQRYKTPINIQSVTNASGDVLPYSTRTASGNVEAKIGDPDKLLSGVQTYIITYIVSHALNWFDGEPELYWNVTGNEWGVAIDRASATITSHVDLQPERTECFTGIIGSTEKDCTVASNPPTIRVVTNDSLPAINGLTVVTRLPQGSIPAPTTLQKTTRLILDNIWLLLPLVVFCIMLLLWYKIGRDPKGRGVIIPEYEPPAGMSPGLLGYLVDERIDTRDITATILGLAVKGYVQIRYEERKGLLKFGHTYRLVRRKEGDASLSAFERRLLTALFPDDAEVTIEELKRTFPKELAELRKALEGDAKDFFALSPQKIATPFRILAVLFFVAGGIAAGTEDGSLVGGLVLSGLIVMGFSFLLPRRSEKGVLAREYILGFKRFLTVTDAERLKFHNAPQKKPEQFMAFLPFAVALAVEKDWAKQFEGMMIPAPDWYVGRDWAALNAIAFVSSVKDFTSATTNRAFSSAKGAGGGMSGFGGGGFSGGGFGGGGGGSW